MEAHLHIIEGYLKTYLRLAIQPHYTDDEKRQASAAFLNLYTAKDHVSAALHDLERVQ